MRLKLIIIFIAISFISIILFSSEPSPLKHFLNKTSPIQPLVTPAEYVTNPIRSDGFGAQFQSIIYSLIFAELNHLKFIYTPFTSMEHNYNNDDLFLHRKEALINFIDNFEIVKDHRNIIEPDFIKFKEFFESNIGKVANSESLRKIKVIFRTNKSRDFFNNDRINIAVHVRRPNNHDIRVEGSDVPDQVFMKILNFLKMTYSSKNYLIHVYSQGSIDNFKPYEGKNIIFHLDESLEDTFTGMVLADALVMSPSSLSYSAGLLSDGVVYYMPFWHAPLPTWRILKINNDGVVIVKKAKLYHYPKHGGY